MSTKQCVNCPGAVDHTTAECPLRATAPVGVPDDDGLAPGYGDGHDWEGFPGGCARLGCSEGCSAALSAQQSAQPEFCCKHSYKVAKQAAGSAVGDGPDITTKHGYPAYSVAQHERIVAALSAQQSAPERGDGWIPVNERLPSMVQEVIVNSEFDGVTAGILDSYGEWYSPNSDYKLTRVVAWQPLPAAPSLPNGGEA